MPHADFSRSDFGEFAPREPGNNQAQVLISHNSHLADAHKRVELVLLCRVTGGRHIYAMQRTPDGRPVCTECQEPAAALGA